MDEKKSESILTLTADEAKKLQIGIERCFTHASVFTEDEMDGLEAAYDKLMGIG